MLTLQQIKENPQYIVERLAVKGFDGKAAIDRILTLDDAAAKEITEILLTVPNIPCEMVPEGKTAADNVVEKTGGPMPDLPEDALPHWELAKKYNLIDFDLGVKITGAGFPVYIGKGAKLQRALIQFFLDRASEAGYLEIQPPYVVNEASGYGTGQLPDKEGQMYHVNLDNLYLIPTAEVPVTNLYRDVILTDLPVKNCAYSAATAKTSAASTDSTSSTKSRSCASRNPRTHTQPSKR